MVQEVAGRQRLHRLERPRFELDRVWLLRAALLVAVVAFLVLFVRVAVIGFRSGNASLERMDRSLQEPPAAQPSLPASR